MTATVKKILKQAHTLPAIDRVELIERLFSSFDFPDRDKIDALWAKEAEERIKNYNAGRIKAVAASKVFGKIQKIR